ERRTMLGGLVLLLLGPCPSPLSPKCEPPHLFAGASCGGVSCIWVQSPAFTVERWGF
uniref:Uncharacterized protein n=1 Tax=Pongo abelii TaxID=9601 RepID=A0A8I5YJP6_PONAB